MIRSFADDETPTLYETGRSRRWSSIARVAARKLAEIDSVAGLDELNAPPGNRLQALRGDRAGQHSIRIDDGGRICFRRKSDELTTCKSWTTTEPKRRGRYEHQAS